MIQINKRSKRKRKIRRAENTSPYPVESSSQEPMDTDEKSAESDPVPQKILSPDYLAREVPGTTDLLSQVNAYKRNVGGLESANHVVSDTRMEDNEKGSCSKHMKDSEEEKHSYVS